MIFSSCSQELSGQD